MELIKRVHANNIVKWGKTHSDAIVLSADLTSSCEIDEFRDAFPDRFLSMGLMEQNMMSFAAGLAREGLTPMVHTFAVFMYRRSLDQIEMSIAYPNLPVKIFGFLPGVTTPGGASHQAINDIAVMRLRVSTSANLSPIVRWMKSTKASSLTSSINDLSSKVV